MQGTPAIAVSAFPITDYSLLVNFQTALAISNVKDAYLGLFLFYNDPFLFYFVENYICVCS